MTTQTSGALCAVKHPLSGAVIQRDGASANLPILLDATERARLFVRLRKGGSTVPRFDWHAVGQCECGETSCVLENVSVGGEYTLELELRAARGEVIGSASVNRLLVGDLWILGGQSNMDGWGKLVGTEAPSRLVHAFYYDDRWDRAADPLCWYSEATDSVHWPVQDPEQLAHSAKNDRRFRQQGAGPAVAFGKTLVKRTGVPVGLIVCSHGGTSMDQWSPAKLSEGSASLYGSMIRRVKAVGGRAAGMLWYQGESDANKGSQPAYRQKMREFVAAVRRDLGSPRLPFIYVQIGPFFAGAEIAEHWNALQADQLAVEAELAPALMAASIDSGLDDLIHLDTASQRRLGRRLAHLAEILVHGRTSLSRGPRPATVRFADEARTILRVRFTEVNLGLWPKRNIRGFWAKKDGRDLAIVRQEVDPNQTETVVLRFEEPVPPESALWYGLGVNPVVNLVDEADLAAPVFGPLTI